MNSGRIDTIRRLIGDAAKMSVVVSEPQATQLLDYLALLAKWNGVYNLTAIRDPEQMRVQHVLDSLSVLPHLDKQGITSLLDVGTGGGLPGVVLAIMRPTWRIVLNDIVQKKTAFLMQAKSELKLTEVGVHNGRVEDYRPKPLFDGVISRAFADLADFVNGARHVLNENGTLFAMKGLSPEDEVRRLPDGARMVERAPLVVTDLNASRHLLIVKFDERFT